LHKTNKQTGQKFQIILLLYSFQGDNCVEYFGCFLKLVQYLLKEEQEANVVMGEKKKSNSLVSKYDYQIQLQ
jgi:hypothetical protein